MPRFDVIPDKLLDSLPEGGRAVMQDTMDRFLTAAGYKPDDVMDMAVLQAAMDEGVAAYNTWNRTVFGSNLPAYRQAWLDYLNASRLPLDVTAQGQAAAALEAISAAAATRSALACLRLLSVRVAAIQTDPRMEAEFTEKLGDSMARTVMGPDMQPGEADFMTAIFTAARSGGDEAKLFPGNGQVLLNRSLLAIASWYRGQVAEGADGDQLAADLVDEAVFAVADPDELPPEGEYFQRPLRLHGDPNPTAVCVRQVVDAHRSLMRWWSGRGGSCGLLVLHQTGWLFSCFPGHPVGPNAHFLAHARHAITSGLSGYLARGGTPPTLVQALSLVQQEATTAGDHTAAAAAQTLLEGAADVDMSGRHYVDVMTAVVGRALRTALDFVADGDMCAVLAASAMTMPAQPLLEADLPAASGLLWFAQPISVNDIRATRHAGLLWTVVSRDYDGNPDAGIVMLPIVRLDPDQLIFTGEPAVGVMGVYSVWRFGETFDQYAQRTYSGPDTLTDVFRVLPALWAISRQPLAAVHREHLEDRRARKAATRAGTYPADGITVISLRRRLPAPPGPLDPEAGQLADDPEGRHVNWRSRWMVRAHWRQQWYPSTQTHRAILVLPFIKGPEDKPLRNADRVWVVQGRDLPP